MNFPEVMTVLKALSEFQVKDSEEALRVHVYDNQNEGYVLWTKQISENTEYTCFVRKLAEERNLRIREFRDYLIIYSF